MGCWSLWERMRMKREEGRVTGGGRLEEHSYIRGNAGGRKGRWRGEGPGGDGKRRTRTVAGVGGGGGGGCGGLKAFRVSTRARQKMDAVQWDGEGNLVSRGLSRSWLRVRRRTGSDGPTRPGPGAGTGTEQWSVVDGMAKDRTAHWQHGGSLWGTDAQMEGLEGLGGVTQPGPSAGFRPPR